MFRTARAEDAPINLMTRIWLLSDQKASFGPKGRLNQPTPTMIENDFIPKRAEPGIHRVVCHVNASGTAIGYLPLFSVPNEQFIRCVTPWRPLSSDWWQTLYEVSDDPFPK